MIVFFSRYRDCFHLRDKRIGNVLLDVGRLFRGDGVLHALHRQRSSRRRADRRSVLRVLDDATAEIAEHAGKLSGIDS